MRELVKIVSRTISIFLISKAIDLIYYISMYSRYPADTHTPHAINWYMTLFSISAAVLVLSAIFFWVFSSFISSLLIGKDNKYSDAIKIDFNKVQTIVFVVLGIVILSDIFLKLSIALAEWLMYRSQYNNSLNVSVSFSPNFVVYMLEPCIRAIFGILLILYSKRLSNLLIKPKDVDISEDELAPDLSPETGHGDRSLVP